MLIFLIIVFDKMFKIDECVKSSGIFNDIIIKRFEENFSPENNSRLWLTPGHCIFTTNNNTKVHTYDTRPYDFSSSPSESDSDELLSTVSEVVHIFFDTESASTRMFIALMNGDVQIFEYRILLFEWARIGYFNVNIVSPNSNNNHHNIVPFILISLNQNTVYWSEKTGNSDACFNLNKREVLLNGVREITQSSVGIPQKILKNCPQFDLVEIRDNICIVPHLPNSVNLYLITSARSQLWAFHIDGKLLYRGSASDSPIDFISLCMKVVGLWSESGIVKVCKLLNHAKNHAYLLHNKQLLLIAPNGEISKKVSLNINVTNLQDCYVMHNSLFAISDKVPELHIYNLNNEQLIQSMDLNQYNPLCGVWYNSSYLPSLGFYSNKAVYKVNYRELSSMLVSETPSMIPLLMYLKQEHFCIFLLLKDLIKQRFEGCKASPFKVTSNVLQSEALLLAILQSCREKGVKPDAFPLNEITKLLRSEKKSGFTVTKLKELLDPLTECYMKFETTKNMLCQDESNANSGVNNTPA